MKTLRGIWYGIQLFWLALAADPPRVVARVKQWFVPPPVCERCLGDGEIRVEAINWAGSRTVRVETPCKRCGGNGLEP